MLAVVIDALALQQLQHQRQRLLLEIAPAVEIDSKAVELVFAVTRAQAEREAPVAENIDECRILGNAQRVGERQRHHGGADLDAAGQRREIARVDEHVGHDAVFIAEMMFGDPRVVVAELVGVQDLPGYPRMHIAVRIGLGIDVGMGCEQNSEFHAWPVSCS